MLKENRVKRHFEDEAGEYDEIILRLIPNYRLMVEILTSLLRYPEQSPLEVIDLGCGTGAIARAVKDRFPTARLTCVDIAQNMLDIASSRVGPDTNLIRADFNSFDFPEKYDAAVSSLALHHLGTDADKFALYRKIHGALECGGMFINIDVVQSADAALQELYLQRWRDFMLRSTPREEVDGKWLPSYYAEDRPIPLTAHLDMLREAGFATIDVAYKYYNYAVYCARK